MKHLSCLVLGASVVLTACSEPPPAPPPPAAPLAAPPAPEQITSENADAAADALEKEIANDKE